MQFVRDHPVVASGSFVVGGGLGYGLSHHFLDFETPYAIGAGVALGVGVVGAEAWAYSEYQALKVWLNGITAPVRVVAAGVDNTVDAIKSGEIVSGPLEGVKEALGMSTDHIELDAIEAHGTPEQKELVKQIKALMFGPGVTDKDRDKKLAELTTRLKESLDEMDPPDGHDAAFTDNTENPPPIVQQPPNTAANEEYDEQWNLQHPDEAAAANGADGTFEDAKKAFEDRAKAGPGGMGWSQNGGPGFSRGY